MGQPMQRPAKMWLLSSSMVGSIDDDALQANDISLKQRILVKVISQWKACGYIL
jgi:hypothetical protein